MALTPEARAKMIDKIKKVLALASDPSITEGEQDNYRRRARILMETFCVSQVDCAEDMKGLIVKEFPFVPSPTIRIDSNLNATLPWIINPIAHFFGCFVICRTNPRGQREDFIVGFESNYEIVNYTVNTVLFQARPEYQRLYKLTRSISFAPEFWKGFAVGIQEKFRISKDEESSELGLILYDKVKAYMDSMNIGTYAQFGFQSNAFNQAGETTGRNVTLHTGLNQSQNGGKLLG